VLWELVTRAFMGEYKAPYYSDNKGLQHDAAILIQVARKGLRPSIRNEIPTCLSTLVQWCWNQDPGKRPTTGLIRVALLLGSLINVLLQRPS
jgi:hypothetical protein